MKKIVLFIFTGIILSGNAQTNTASKKPFPFMGNFTLNYEVKKAGIPATKGNIICAFNISDAALIPSFANTMQDILAAKLLINTNSGEMTMLTTTKTNKKSGLLTLIPKAIIEKASKPPVFTKTTLTKTIQTFSCQKIIMTLSDSTKVEAWITNAIALPVNDAIQFTNLGFKNKSPLINVNINALNATSLETVITYKNGDAITITATDIKKVKPAVTFFSSDGYNIMDARGLQMR